MKAEARTWVVYLFLFFFKWPQGGRMKEQGQRAVDSRVCCGGWCCRQTDSVPGFFSLLVGSWNFTVTSSCSWAVLLTTCVPTLLGWPCFLAKLATLSQSRKKETPGCLWRELPAVAILLGFFPYGYGWNQLGWCDKTRAILSILSNSPPPGWLCAV